MATHRLSRGLESPPLTKLPRVLRETIRNVACDQAVQEPLYEFVS